MLSNPQGSTNQNVTEFSIRIVSIQKNGFIQKVFGMESGKVWEIKIDKKQIKNLSLGHIYNIKGSKSIYTRQLTEMLETQELKQAQSQNYALSSAVVGSINMDQTYGIKVCDFWCGVILKIDDLRRYATNQIQSSSCNLYSQDWAYLSPFDSCTDIAALLQGLLLGGSQSFSKNMQQNFRTTGITHIVAISGFNISLIIVLVQGILEKIKLGFKIQFTIILLFLSLFVVLVGPTPSVLRAALMGVIMLLARLFGRSCGGIRALILASVVMLTYNPYYIFSVSFQLSFLATFGLISFLDITEVLSFKGVELIKETAWATIVANLYTLPILINTFGYFSPLSIIPNVIILPIVPLTMLLELLLFVPFIGNYLGIFAGLICAWILGFVEWLSSWLPLVYMEKLETWEVCIWYLGLAGLAFLVRYKREVIV